MHETEDLRVRSRWLLDRMVERHWEATPDLLAQLGRLRGKHTNLRRRLSDIDGLLQLCEQMLQD